MTTKITMLIATLLMSYMAQAQIYFNDYETKGDGSKLLKGQCIQSWDNNTLAWKYEDSSVLNYNSQKVFTDRVERRYNTTNNTWDFYTKYRETKNANGQTVLDVDSNINYIARGQRVFTYNSNSTVDNFVFKTSDASNNWINNFRVLYSYTSYDSLATILKEQWVNSSWKYALHELHLKNAQKLDSILTRENYSHISNQWIPDVQYTYTYFSTGKLKTKIRKEYNTTNNSYVLIKKEDYTYNSNGQLVTYITADNINNTWEPQYKLTNTYNAQGLLINTLREEYDMPSLSYKLDYKIAYTYNSKNKVTHYLQEWHNGTIWVNDMQITYTYDATNQFLIHFESEQWNLGLNAWRGTMKYDNWYITNTPTAINDIAPRVQLSVYPNPVSNGMVYVNADSKTDYIISNMQGQVVNKGTLIPGTNTIIMQQPAGNYILNAGGASAKIVVQ